MSRPTHNWCPSCEEESAINGAGECLWCGGPTRRKYQSRPYQRGSRYTEVQLRALYAVYEKGRSINRIAAETHAKAGYKTPNGAAFAIGREWRRMGLKLRTNAEANRLALGTHLMSRQPGYSAYRRRVVLGEPDQPPCRGTKKNGEPCARLAARGSEFCPHHDPAKIEEREANMAALHEKRFTPEMVPIGPFSQWLRSLYERDGSWPKVAARFERTVQLIHRYGANTKGRTHIAREAVERLTEIEGSKDFHDLYPDVDPPAADPGENERVIAGVA